MGNQLYFLTCRNYCHLKTFFRWYVCVFACWNLLGTEHPIPGQYPQERIFLRRNAVTSGPRIPPDLSVLAFPQGASCLVWLPAFNEKVSYLQGNHQHLASCSHFPQSPHPAPKLISPCSKGKGFCQTFLILSNLFTQRRKVGGQNGQKRWRVLSFQLGSSKKCWHFLELHLMPS